MADLTMIDGVGPSRQDSLHEAGYDSPKAVAEAPREHLEEVLGASADVEQIKESARDEVEDGPLAQTKTLTVDDREMALYLIKGLIDENIRLKQSNRYDEAEEVNYVVERVINGTGDDGGDVEVTLDDLSYLYTSIRNIEQTFQQTRGVTDLVGDMRDMRVQIQDLRSGLWPDT